MEVLAQLVDEKNRWIAGIILFAFLFWEGIFPFFGFYKNHLKERVWHGVRNLTVGVLNSAMNSFGFVVLWLWAAEFANTQQIGIGYWLPMPGWCHAVVVILMFDFWTYWWHWANHRVPFLWRFHRVHHSDNRMDVTTAIRFHPGEIFLSSILRVFLIILFGAKLWHLALFELLQFPIIQFHHANIGILPWLDKALRVFIVTPAMHKVHHSRVQPETDSNYTSLLSVWDRIFGSFRIKEDPRLINFGLDQFDDPPRQSFAGLMKTPIA